MPDGVVVPVGPVDDRVQADAVDRDAGVASARDLVGDVLHPGGAAAADMARLGHHQRAPVAHPGLAQQHRQRHAARIAEVPGQAFPGAELPLARVVVIDPEEVEGGAMASELGQERAGDHVPGLPLVCGDLGGAGHEMRCVGRWGDVDQGFDVEEARPGILCADRLHRAQRGLHQPPLDLPADIAANARGLGGCRPYVGTVDETGFGERPGEVADLVDRRVDRRFRAARSADGARGSACKLCKPVGKVDVEDPGAWRHAVVHQGPENLQAVPGRGLGHAQRPREIERGRRSAAGTQAPADAFADAADAEGSQARVVVFEMCQMAVGLCQVQRLPVRIDVVGTFEPCHPEGSIRRIPAQPRGDGRRIGAGARVALG